MIPTGTQIVLLAEDNEDDVFIMERVFQKSNITWPLHIVTDGQQAIDYLSGTGKYSDRKLHPLPTIMFLDLKLPYLQGFEVLCWIRKQPHLTSMLVIILTSSLEDQDIAKALAFGAPYIVKPPTPRLIRETLESAQKK